MPSNDDLRIEANSLAKELDLNINPSEMNNKTLVKLVADLKAKKRDIDLDTEADKAQDDKPEDIESADNDNIEVNNSLPDEADGFDEDPEESGKPEKPEDAKPTGFKVAAGKALTTRRGIKADGDKVDASHFVGGQKVIDEFIKTGHIVQA